MLFQEVCALREIVIYEKDQEVELEVWKMKIVRVTLS